MSSNLEQGLRNIVSVLEIYNGTIAMLSGKVQKLEEDVKKLEEESKQNNKPNIRTLNTIKPEPLAPSCDPACQL